MRYTLSILLMAASVAAASAQTPAKPASPASATAKKPAIPGARPAAPGAGAIKLPPGVPPGKGLVKTAFTLRYQDLVVGTGAVAEPNKLYKVHYTGWLAADGRKFDSSYDHRSPETDKDGKPVNGPDGKPKLGEPQPFSFPQGFGRLIPGWDQGFEGMKIGGKRRLFIPYELGYGVRGVPSRDADHPGIPSKADLIFDIELLEVGELPTRPGGPGGPGAPGARPLPGIAPKPPTPGTPAAAPGAPAAPAAPAAGTPAPATPPATPPPAPASPATPPPAPPK